MPSGAVTTPPDSSDDEERGRSSIGSLRELQEALQHIDVKRLPSPHRDAVPDTPVEMPPPMTLARSLSAEARKITHSRSSSDVMLSSHVAHPLNTETVVSSSG
jgi:hypothetical protein